MRVTATEAKNRFGYLCAQAKSEPVIVEKEGRPDTVLVDYEEFQALKSAALNKTLAQRKKEFNKKHGEWIAQQNAHAQEHGLWCDGLVPWMENT